jgi:hypothetical protein
LGQQYDIQKVQLLLRLRQKDNSLQTIVAPPSAGDVSGGANAATSQATQTLNLIQAQGGILTAQTQLITLWINYVTQRMVLIKDLGTIPYDEWEAFYEFFPDQARAAATDAARAAAGPPGPPAPAPAPPPGGGR